MRRLDDRIATLAKKLATAPDVLRVAISEFGVVPDQMVAFSRCHRCGSPVSTSDGTLRCDRCGAERAVAPVAPANDEAMLPGAPGRSYTLKLAALGAGRKRFRGRHVIRARLKPADPRRQLRAEDPSGFPLDQSQNSAQETHMPDDTRPIDLPTRLLRAGMIDVDEHHRIMRNVRDAGLLDDAPAPASTSPSRRGSVSSAQARIDEIMKDPKHAYYIREHPGHADAVREVSALFAQTE